MTNDFTFQNTTKVHFGRNAMSKLSSEVVQYGHSILLVYGGTFLKKCGLYDKIVNELKKEDITIYDYDLVKPNPRHTDINIGGRMYRDHGIEAVLGIGGGGAIDNAKAIAALALADTDNCWDMVMAALERIREE